MASIDKVGIFMLAIELARSGDKNNSVKIDNLINMSVQNERKNNTYFETVHVDRIDKKLFLRICD